MEECDGYPASHADNGRTISMTCGPRFRAHVFRANGGIIIVHDGQEFSIPVDHALEFQQFMAGVDVWDAIVQAQREQGVA